MAFLKEDLKGGITYLRIVESKREDGKIKHQTICSLGKLSDYTPEMLQNIGRRLFELGKGDLKDLLGSETRELGRYNYGYVQLFGKIIRSLGLNTILSRVEKKHKLKFNLEQTVLLMLIERLHDPCSKRANFTHQQEYLGIEPVTLQWLYRSLDYLADYHELIQKQLFHATRDLFNQQLDVVFYDVTTFYFESDIRIENALRQKGFSKDGKIGNTQVLFGLLIDKDKNPIGFEVYKGNTFEGHTFEDALKRIKEKYQIQNIVIVADRGMLSHENLSIVEANQYQFIVGDKIKSLPNNVKDYLLDIKNYTREWTLPGDEKHSVKYASIEYNGRLILSTYSQKRAAKDEQEREEKLQRAKILLKNPSQLQKKAQHYFLQNHGENKYTINEERIKENKRYGGFLAIATNAVSLSAETILDHYTHLFQIEHSFRTFKSHLETRPMFHWTDKRILGHLTLCYICYALLQHVLNKLKNAGFKTTEAQLRSLLDKMQLSLVAQGKNQFYLRSNMDDTAKVILQKAGVNQIPNIFPKQNIINYL